MLLYRSWPRCDANLRDVRDPALATFFTRLCALRNRHADVLLDGRFVDNEGFLADNSRVSAHAFCFREPPGRLDKRGLAVGGSRRS